MAMWALCLLIRLADTPRRRLYHLLPQVANRLFGVDIVPADGQAPIWHEDVRFFNLLKDGKPKASFYLDPYSR